MVDPGIHLFEWTRKQAAAYMDESGVFMPSELDEMVYVSASGSFGFQELEDVTVGGSWPGHHCPSSHTPPAAEG